MRKLSILFVLASGLLLLAHGVSAQEIYRVVDEDGNVTYTDQKPSESAEPMALPELNVLEGDLDSGENPLAEADRPGMDFRIRQPANGETITPAGGQIDVVMDIGIEVPPTARITLVLDGRDLPPVRSLETSIPTPEAGQHKLFARLETPSGRVLGTTDPVEFSTAAPDGD